MKKITFLVAALICLATLTTIAAPRPRPHPLTPPSKQELTSATTLVLRDTRWKPSMRFVSVQLREPSKAAVLRNDTSIAREIFCVLFDDAANATYEVFVDARLQEVTEWRRVNKVEPSLTIEDYQQMDSIVRADKRWQAGIARRNLKPTDVYIDGWASGITIASFGTRMMRTVTYQRNGPLATFDRPLEGMEALVDLTRRVVMEFSDRPKAPVPTPISDPADLKRIASASRLRSLQPSDTRISIKGNEVAWHQWRFRVSMNSREGLILQTIRVKDGDRERPIAYRMNLGEMVVPYGDTTQSWFWRAAFDVGEYGLGQLSSSLVPGVDAPSNAIFLPALFTSSKGVVTQRKNTIAVFERDAGILWRHTYDNGSTIGRRDRELVVLHVATVGNYDYSIGYVFGLDGSIKTEVQLTGLLLPKAVQDTMYDAASTGQMYGGLIQPNVIAPAHQHFFNFRIDLDVDDTANVLSEMDMRSPSGNENRFRNGILMDVFDMRFEQEAQRSMSMPFARSWIVRNATEQNSLHGPTGYMLMPGANSLPYIQPGTWVRNRAGFIDHHLWATRYHDGELYPAGAYPNQSLDFEGLPTYSKNNESINGKDLVLWYTMGITHFPRPEEWPIMSSHRASFSLIPSGFYSRNPAATGAR
jgi:primary-amine oxidase